MVFPEDQVLRGGNYLSTLHVLLLFSVIMFVETRLKESIGHIKESIDSLEKMNTRVKRKERVRHGVSLYISYYSATGASITKDSLFSNVKREKGEIIFFLI